MLNDVNLMGRLTAPPELKATMSGIYVTRFTLAVERDFKDKETGKKLADFIDCVAWSKDAEFVANYGTKGRMTVVNGRLQINNYTDKDGKKRRNAEVVAESVYFADSNNGNRGAENGDNYQSEGFTEVGDEELPF